MTYIESRLTLNKKFSNLFLCTVTINTNSDYVKFPGYNIEVSLKYHVCSFSYTKYGSYKICKDFYDLSPHKI